MGEQEYQRIFSTNLKKYMDKCNKTQIDIINDLGFNKSSVSTWVNGTRLPRMDKVDILARYFGVKRSDLLEEGILDEEVVFELSSIEKEIIRKYRTLSLDAKEMLLRSLGIEQKGDAMEDCAG